MESLLQHGKGTGKKDKLIQFVEFSPMAADMASAHLILVSLSACMPSSRPCQLYRYLTRLELPVLFLIAVCVKGVDTPEFRFVLAMYALMVSIAKFRFLCMVGYS